MRTNKLIAPALQLRLSLWFVAATAAGLLFQYLLVSRELADLAGALPGDATEHHVALASAARSTLLFSLLVILPLIAVLGVLTTFRLVGPLYRIRCFLEAVARGEAPPDCRLRRGDELQDLCRLANEATRPVREAPIVGDDRHVEREAA